MIALKQNLMDDHDVGGYSRRQGSGSSTLTKILGALVAALSITVVVLVLTRPTSSSSPPAAPVRKPAPTADPSTPVVDVPTQPGPLVPKKTDPIVVVTPTTDDVDCVSHYSDYGECRAIDADCGTGQKVRMRVVTVAPRGNGAPCAEETEMSVPLPCQLPQQCPPVVTPPTAPVCMSETARALVARFDKLMLRHWPQMLDHQAVLRGLWPDESDAGRAARAKELEAFNVDVTAARVTADNAAAGEGAAPGGDDTATLIVERAALLRMQRVVRRRLAVGASNSVTLQTEFDDSYRLKHLQFSAWFGATIGDMMVDLYHGDDGMDKNKFATGLKKYTDEWIALARKEGVVGGNVITAKAVRKLVKSAKSNIMTASLMGDVNEASTKKRIAAWQALADFYGGEYMAVAQRLRPDATPGVFNCTDSADIYQHQLDAQLGDGYTAEERHFEGVRRLAALQETTAALGKEHYGAVSFADTLVQLNAADNKEQYVYESPEGVRERAAMTMRTLSTVLTREFRRMPRCQTSIEFIGGPSAPIALYRHTQSHSLDRCPRRPSSIVIGLKSVDNPDVSARPSAMDVAVLLHEGSPGHHFQIMAAEDARLAANTCAHGSTTLEKADNNSVYTEGWGLYSEWLGLALGVYDAPRRVQRFGYLQMRMLRAARMVCDTGVNHFGWSAARVVAFLVDNVGLEEFQAVSELTRYVSDPGQAVAYMTGATVFEETRAAATATVGGASAFALGAPDFHQRLLDAGPLPMPLVRELGALWAAESKAAADALAASTAAAQRR